METTKKARTPRKKKNIMKVDLDVMSILAEKGKDIIVTPEAEASILQLLSLQEKVNEAVENMKAAIAKAGTQYNPNFTSIKGEKVKIMYREYGGKFGYDATRIDDIPKTLYKPRVTIALDGKAIEKWTEEHGGLPLGIFEHERAKTLSISLKKEK
jgi:hypothetical protein